MDENMNGYSNNNDGRGPGNGGDAYGWQDGGARYGRQQDQQTGGSQQGGQYRQDPRYTGRQYGYGPQQGGQYGYGPQQGGQYGYGQKQGGQYGGPRREPLHKSFHDNYEYRPDCDMPNENSIGHSKALGSVICGGIGVILFLFYGVPFFGLLSTGLGIAGLILASNAKAMGNTEDTRRLGFWLSLISLIVGGTVFVACLSCVGGGMGLLGCLADNYHMGGQGWPVF